MSTHLREEPLLTQSVANEKAELLTAQPQIDTDNVHILLETYKETEGLPPVIRRAKYFSRLCAEKGIFIDNNPLAGTLTKHKYGAFVSFETGCSWMERVDKFSLQRGQVSLSREDKEQIRRGVECWKDINSYSRTRELIRQSHGIDIALWMKCGVGIELAPSAFNGGVPDFHKILEKGFDGIIREIEEAKSKLDIGDPHDLDKWHFLGGAHICLDAMIELAQRYASLAKEMAKDESNPQRKAALERIVQTCEWVPAHPPRDFFEALQTVWFVTMGEWMENHAVLICPPSRFTQYMYPFFKKDKEEGKLDDEQAIELLHFFFIKLNGLAQIMPPHGYAWNQSRLGLHLSLGGLTPEGEDATTELDYLILEAQRRIRLPEPLVSLLYHPKLSEELLLKCVDLIRTGIGQPAFHDIAKAIQRHMYHDNTPVEEARNISIAGCVQSNIPGYTGIPWEGHFSATKMIELALNNGVDPLSGTQLGPQTGKAEAFESYEEFRQAVIQQIAYFLPVMRTIGRAAWNIKRDFPTPFTSALVNDCISNGQDVIDGGARYNGLNGASIVGGIDLANSLAAVKKLVFDEQKITMQSLLEALAADFEGHEEIHRMCMSAPKYGNNDNYVDSIAKDMYAICYREHQRFPDHIGRPTKPEAYSVTTHFAVGRFTGALPSGRRARLPLTDATVSAMPGTDKDGPTSLISSAAKVIDTVKYGSNHFNMKFHPSALDGTENARKFLSMIRTYFDLGGYHVQFNCVSYDTLKDAQLHPENYRDLVVRVAGFSAFFIHLDRAVQDEIIKRTELKFGAS